MPIDLDSLRSYTLVVCEKPEAARRIADALKDGGLSRVGLGRVDVHVVEGRSQTYVVCAASGHLYTVSDPSQTRSTYPVFDIEWFPVHLVDKKAPYVAKRIEVLEKLAKNASRFVHACDFDLEGETIGYNMLRYACGGKEGVADRAKFSTLTYDELRSAFASAKPGLGGRLAEAGRARHVVDFVYGVNLSRALTEAFRTANNRYRTISIGRVQGPTLACVVEREVEVRSFVPTPYWAVDAVVEAATARLTAAFERERVERLQEAQHIKESCEGKEGIVSRLERTVFRQAPPPPFNIGDLQHEAYRVFRFTPSQTLALAERLYLDALISYPRTSSQKLPPSINYRRILAGLRQLGAYQRDADEVLRGRLIPHEGDKYDPAHPAIHPTGEVPKRVLEPRENKLYDLIVRRFFAVFGEEAVRERVAATIAVAGYNFRAFGRRTLQEGWLRYYRSYRAAEEGPLPALQEGESVQVRRVDVLEKFDQPPARYNQSSLLGKMEQEGVGTKTTRAEIIRTLYERGYVVGESMMATDIGFVLLETMQTYSPAIISTDLTRSMEADMERIGSGELDGGEIVERAAEQIVESVRLVKTNEIPIGRAIQQAVRSTTAAQNLLGDCPVCKTGKLTIVRSAKTGKRFVGCTHYRQGCRASAPLPQRGAIRTTSKVCPTCGWPIIYVKLGRIPWKLCVNVNCPAKADKKAAQVPYAARRSVP